MNIPSKLTFLYRRPFWAVIIGLVALFGCFAFYQSVIDFTHVDTNNIIFYFEASFGGLFWLMAGYKFFGTIGGYVFGVGYFIFIAYLIRQTFKEEVVHIQYPLIFLILYVTGFQFARVFFSGL